MDNADATVEDEQLFESLTLNNEITFEEFQTQFDSVIRLSVSPTRNYAFECTCWYYAKKLRCLHVRGFSIEVQRRRFQAGEIDRVDYHPSIDVAPLHRVINRRADHR